MKTEERVKAMITWGQAIGAMTDELGGNDAAADSPAQFMMAQARAQNPWFTRENILSALKGIVFMLQEENLNKWVSKYVLNDVQPKTIGVIMAGNIPAAGFHDALSVLVSGHRLMMKCASDDKVILPFLLDILVAIEPRFSSQYQIVERLQSMDAVIATGSNNSARYFDYYFGKYPHIIRKNRNSLAILNGSESAAELSDLGGAIFTYFGMGCRSISHLLVPKGYQFNGFFESMQQYGDTVMQHTRFMHNFDYHNALYLLNSEKFLTNNFLILRESPVLSTPVSVLHYSYYNSDEEAMEYISMHEYEIQCVMGKHGIPFAEAQLPAPWNYPDNVDVMEFLSTKLN